jgi:SAM-dependent methyltransferase
VIRSGAQRLILERSSGISLTDYPGYDAAMASRSSGSTANRDLRGPIEETRQTYDHITAEWARLNSTPQPHLVHALGHLAASIRPGGVVADVGCGPGLETRLLRERGLRVVGLDLSIGQLKTAGLPGVVQADMLHLPLRTGSVDAIWCQAALLHIPHRLVPLVLTEFARTVRPGGELCLYVLEGEGEGFEAASKYGSQRRRWFTLHREPGLVSLLTASGLAVNLVSRSSGLGVHDWLFLHAIRAPGSSPALPPQPAAEC